MNEEDTNDMTELFVNGFMLISEESLGPCMICGEGIIIKFCRQYLGFMGKCITCNINWRES